MKLQNFVCSFVHVVNLAAEVTTLRCLINREARLLILETFSTLDILIRPSPFIYFWKNFLPPRLLRPPRLLTYWKIPSLPVFKKINCSNFADKLLFFQLNHLEFWALCTPFDKRYRDSKENMPNLSFCRLILSIPFCYSWKNSTLPV